MATKRPQNKAQFSQISGVGAQKLERYADEFLNVIVADSLPEILQNKLSDTINETLMLYLDGHNCDEIANRWQINQSTVMRHFADSIEAGLLSAEDVLDLDENEINIIRSTVEETDAIVNNQLKPVFEALSGAYEYDVIRCVMAEMALE
jgi:ATP-dependent DNA helicase RecQ